MKFCALTIFLALTTTSAFADHLQSSDSGTITGWVGQNPTITNFSVDVEQFATNETWVASFSGLEDSVTKINATFTIRYRGQDTKISVPANTSLQGLAQIINEKNAGFSAVTYDTESGSTNPARLVIQDKQTGKQNPDQTPGSNYNFEFGSLLTSLPVSAFGYAPIIEGQDSKIFLNGNSADPIYRDSNIITDVIPGLGLVLQNANPGQWIKVNVAKDFIPGQTCTAN